MTMVSRGFLPVLACLLLGCTELERNASGLEAGGSPQSGGAETSGGAVSTGGTGSGGDGTSGSLQTGGVATGGESPKTGGAVSGGILSSGGEASTGGGLSSGGEASTGGDSTGNLTCTQGALERTYGSTTTKSGDDSSGTCGGQGSDDVAVEWVAPRDAWYRLDTFDSDYDTVLYALDGDCDGPELGCSDDAFATTQSEIVAPFRMGQRVVVVVDGKQGASGSGVVRVTEITCPGEDTTAASFPISRNTAQGDTSHTAGCGMDGNADGPERSYLFVPPRDGLYRFTATTSAFTPSIFLERGPACGGQLLACNQGVQDGYPAEVTRYLSGGEPVTLIVDSTGGQGVFQLNAERLDAGARCPASTKSALTPEPVDAQGPSVLSGSCVRAGDASAPMGFPEYSTVFTVPSGIPVGGRCTLAVRSPFPFAFYILKGAQCDGQEYTCEVAKSDGTEFVAELSYGTEAAGTYVLVIEATQGTSGVANYVFETSC